MAISKAEILSDMQDRTSRTDITDIDHELQAIMTDLSNAWPFLQTTSTVTIAAAANSAALPTRVRKVEDVTITASGAKLLRVQHSLLTKLISIDNTAATVLRWAEFKKYLYVHPAALAETVLQLYQFRRRPH